MSDARCARENGTPAPRSAGAPALSVGVDTVRIREVRTSMRVHGRRYLDRVYTSHEQDCCAGGDDVRARGLAARFAAKEATYKALRATDLAGPWTGIEICRAPGGWTDVVLHGAVARYAERAGVRELSVSITHEGDVATAVVVAVRQNVAHGVDARAVRAAEPEQGGTQMSDDVIRQVLADHGHLAAPVESLGDASDLYEAGMTSHASVNVMLGLEDAFDIEFPERLLRKTTFASIASIRAALAELTT